MNERVYLAARFSRRGELRSFAMELEDAGHVVTSRWLYSDDHHLDLRPEDAGAAAERDLDDVRASSVCLAFTESPGERQGRGGRHVEFGVAIALGLRVVVVGESEHVFHLMPHVERVPDATAALRLLGSRPLVEA